MTAKRKVSKRAKPVVAEPVHECVYEFRLSATADVTTLRMVSTPFSNALQRKGAMHHIVAYLRKAIEDSERPIEDKYT